MRRGSSKSQLHSGIQLSIPNSPVVSIPMSVGDLQNSCYQTRQRKPSIHSIQATKIHNINSNASQQPLQQNIYQQQSQSQQEQEDKYQHIGSRFLSSNLGMIQANILTYVESLNNVDSSENSNTSMKGSDIVCSVQQVQQHLKHNSSNQNSHEGSYAGNILQMGVSFSPLSSTYTSSNSNTIANNLLASSNSSGQTNSNNKGDSHVLINNLIPQQNYENQRQNIQCGSQHNENSQISSLEKAQQYCQQEQSSSLSSAKQKQMRKNYSSGNINSFQRSSGSTSSISSKKGQTNIFITKNREPFFMPLSVNTSQFAKQQKFESQSVQQINSLSECKNLNLGTPSSSNGNSSSYEIISKPNKYDSHNLSKQMMSPWINLHQTQNIQQNKQQEYNSHNQSSSLSQNTIISGEKPIQMINKNNSTLQPNKISFPDSYNQYDLLSREDSCIQANSQNLSFISQNSNNIKCQNINNLSANTFTESLSDQKIESNMMGSNPITPFNFNKQEQVNLIQEEAQQVYQHLITPQNTHSQITKSKMCKNHSFKNAKHFILKEQKQQEYYCFSCAVLMYTQGHELYQIDESLELNAMKMIGQQKILQEMENKKEAIDKLMYVAKELIPQLYNSQQSMERKELDIHQFLDQQERSIDSHFNTLIYELNLARQSKLNQIYKCKQDINSKYQIANALCQKHQQDLNKLHQDILNNYDSIVLELEESKVTMIIQNYFQRWNEALVLHDKIEKQEQLDVLKVDQTCFNQIKDQLNFLCNLTLKKQQTTYVKLNDNSSQSTSLLRTPSNKDMRSTSNSRNTPSQIKSMTPSQSTTSFHQSKERKLSQMPFNPSISYNSKTKCIPQQSKEKRIRGNSVLPYNLQKDKLNKSIGFQTNNVQPNQEVTLQNQERKTKSVQHSINLPNKQVYISFDNQDAFRSHFDNENKENITCLNRLQNISNVMMTQKIQTPHHSKSNSVPHQIQIDLTGIQKQLIRQNDQKPSGQIQAHQIYIIDNPPQQQTKNSSQENNKYSLQDYNKCLPQEDCNTFRNRDVYHQNENEQKIGEYLQNAINLANTEKQKLLYLSSNQQMVQKQDEIMQQNQHLKDNIINSQTIYDSIHKQNCNLLHTESDLEYKVQGQTPNFSNKKSRILSPPLKKGTDNNKNQERNELREFNYQTEEDNIFENKQTMIEEQKSIDEIVEKERKSRDSSINKKKQFNEMIKVVQHNQIQRNLNCETILRRVSEHQIDLPSISQNSTPSHHFRSTSGQISILSCKNSINSSHNSKHILGSEEQQKQEQSKKAMKKSPLDEILQSRNAITSEEIGRVIQKLTFENNQNMQISQAEHKQDDHNMQQMNEEVRVSQTIVKQSLDNTYDQMLSIYTSQNHEKINKDYSNNPIASNLHNHPITEDYDIIMNPLKTTQNSEHKITVNPLARQFYVPFNQQYDY